MGKLRLGVTHPGVAEASDSSARVCDAHTSCATSLAFFSLLPAILWGPGSLAKCGCPSGWGACSVLFSGRMWPGVGGKEEQFPRPWKLPTAIGKPAHQIPHKSEPSPVGPSWLPSGWHTVPGSPQDSLSDKSPTSFCLNTLEEANQS